MTKSPHSVGIYAPTLRHHDGRFYMTTTDVNKGGHLIVHVEHPGGPWSDPIFIDQPGTGPTLFLRRGRKGLFYEQGSRPKQLD